MSAVRLREHRCALIWCSYGGGGGRRRKNTTGETGWRTWKKKKKIIFRLLVSEVQISTGYQAAGLGDNVSGCVSLSVSWCVCVPTRSRVMPGQQGPWHGSASAVFASQCPCTQQGSGTAPAAFDPFWVRGPGA